MDDEPLLRFFDASCRLYIEKPFRDLAHEICNRILRCPERTVAIRKLLEAKDAAVRAWLMPDLPAIDRVGNSRVDLTCDKKEIED